MGHYAKVPVIENGKGIVEDVLTITEQELQSGLWGDPFQWIKTSYNTHGGVHYDPNSQTRSPDQSKALRANYAGIGYTYDAVNNVFYDERNQPFPSWVLQAPTWQWQAPVPYPDDGKYYHWDEATLSWVLDDPQPVPPPLSAP
jgi:hypothetical protein